MDDPSQKQADILARYLAGPANLEHVISGLTTAQLDTSLREGSWTIRQIVHHISDGDDLWKAFIKQAIGNPGSEFSLAWYWAVSQDEWAARWRYAARDIEPALALFRANRRHVGQLLQTTPDFWNNTLTVHWPHQDSQAISIGYVVEMQAGHVEHHIAAIREIVHIFGAN